MFQRSFASDYFCLQGNGKVVFCSYLKRMELVLMGGESGLLSRLCSTYEEKTSTILMQWNARCRLIEVTGDWTACV